MSAYWPQTQPLAPEGTAVAGMGRRIVAYIIDGIISGFITGIPAFVLAVVTGAVSLNQAAIDQVDVSATRPFAGVTEPFISVRTPELIGCLALYTALAATYYIGSWIAFRGSPGQLLMSLHLVDAHSGKGLGFGQALARWLTLSGLIGILSAGSVVLTLQYYGSRPGRELFDPTYAAHSAVSTAGASAISNLISLLGLIWMIVLLISAGSRRDKRGLHDRVSGSIVVAPPPIVYDDSGWERGPFQPAGSGWANQAPTPPPGAPNPAAGAPGFWGPSSYPGSTYPGAPLAQPGQAPGPGTAPGSGLYGPGPGPATPPSQPPAAPRPPDSPSSEGGAH